MSIIILNSISFIVLVIFCKLLNRYFIYDKAMAKCYHSSCICLLLGRIVIVTFSEM